jgi:iron complex outermembrane receptor protein
MRATRTTKHFAILPLVGLSIALSAPAFGADTAEPQSGNELETVIVTARLRQEDAQTIPVSVSVVDRALLDETSTYNIQQMTQLVPSLNYVSPNPRNTAFTIRGLGSSVVAVSQANDGLEPGVGFYVDGVYHARPATAAFDFLDLDRVEVLRGPQGTVYGKNTTAGSINLSSQAPTFDTSYIVDASAASEDYWQLKASVNGPLMKDTLAGRVSVLETKRDGVIHDVATGRDLNEIGTTGMRGQLLFTPGDAVSVRFIADHSTFEAVCCTQVYFAVAPTLKPAARQYPALAAGLNYAPPSLNPYDRKTDIDGPLNVDTSESGVSATVDWKISSKLTLTSISAWRDWNWDAENDRDYIGVPVQISQHIPSQQNQYSQEIRVASSGKTVDWVSGVYWFQQEIVGRPITIYGATGAYWLLGPNPPYPSNLLDHYGQDGYTDFNSYSYAAFGEATWRATQKLSVTGGIRYTWEDKNGYYNTTVSGGLDTTGNAFLTNAKLSILRPQSYTAAVKDDSGSGRVALSYAFEGQAMGYLSYARGYKSGGINMSGLPLNAQNQPALATAVIKPEQNETYELGVKTTLASRRLQLNADYFDTTVQDFQANVVDTGPGALRGYLANIPKVHVDGVEVDAAFKVGEHFTAHASATYADGTYVDYKNGPCPIELIGSATTVCDLSGKPLSSLPKQVWTVGGDYAHPLHLGRLNGDGYVHFEVSSRSDIYADPSDSAYTKLAGYTVVNASIGIRRAGPWEFFLWAKNLFDEEYMQNLTVQAGNSGLIVGTPSDPRAVGLTMRATF